MGFLQASFFCLKNYTNLNGRAGRSEFWFFMLFCCVVGSIATLVDMYLYTAYPPQLAEIMPLNLLVNIILVIPNIAATSRRLHDVDRSGKWQFIAVTVIGIIPLLYWLCQKGQPGPNRYGSRV